MFFLFCNEVAVSLNVQWSLQGVLSIIDHNVVVFGLLHVLAFFVSFKNKILLLEYF